MTQEDIQLHSDYALNFDIKMTFENELSFLRSAGAPGYEILTSDTCLFIRQKRSAYQIIKGNLSAGVLTIISSSGNA